MFLHLIHAFNWMFLFSIALPWCFILFFLPVTTEKLLRIVIVFPIAFLLYASLFDFIALEKNFNPFDDYRIEDSQKVDKIKCDSSVFFWYGYYKPFGKLVVCFKDDGDIYMYSDVPYDVYNSFRKNDSLGRYYNQHIKGKYPSKLLYYYDEETGEEWT